MRKIAMVMAVATIVLCSCGGSDSALKTEIEKTEYLKCEKDKLREKIALGDSSLNVQYEKVKQELRDMETTLRDKYKDKLKDESFRNKVKDYVEAARNKCK